MVLHCGLRRRAERVKVMVNVNADRLENGGKTV
jgi:hypothetical protein